MGSLTALVWIWWPDQDGFERPDDCEPVPLSYFDLSPLAQPEDPKEAFHFMDAVCRFAADWFENKVQRGDWEAVPAQTKDCFTRLHVQCVDGGPVIQIDISCEWSPTFSGSIVDYENRRENEEDPRRAYTAIREAKIAAQEKETTP